MKSRHAILALAVSLTLFSRAQATSFTISNASTTAQTLGTASGQTGDITSTGSLTLGGTTVAITISGNSATLTNLGTINQTGTGRAIRDNVGVTGLVVNNGSTTNSSALMQTADADVIQMNKSPASVTLNNYGTMTSLNASVGGSQAVDFTAIVSGTNIINNYATGIMQASEADAVRPGVNGVVNNAGTIKSTTSTGSSSDGIDAQTNSGVNITNANNAGGGTGTGLIEGARHGITGGNTTLPGTFTMSVTNNLGGTIQGDNGSGINIDGLNGNETVTVINHGSITGNGITGDGDGLDVDGLVNLTNTGTIRSINAFSNTAEVANSEGLSVGGGTITNSGLIEGDVASGNTNAIGRGISLVGNDTTTAGVREAIYGNATVINKAGGVIRGQSDSGIAVGGPASGYTVSITNEAGGTIEGGGAAAAAIQTAADNDTVNNAGTIIADKSGQAISLGAGNDILNITGGAAAITGGIDGGSGGESTGDILTFDLGLATNTFTYSGAITNFEVVNSVSGKTLLSGASTYSGTTQVGGGSVKARLEQNGSHTGGGNITVKNNGILAGKGTESLANSTNLLTIDTGGILAPGTESERGRLTLALGSVVINGTAGFILDGASPAIAGGYNQLLLSVENSGTFTLGGSSLLSLTLNFTPVVGTQFTLVDLANSNTHVVGTFNGLAQGAVFTVNSTQFQISYTGGDGNDITVTAVPEAGSWAYLLIGAGLFCYFHRTNRTKERS